MPQAAAEPRIQDVRVLLEALARRLFGGHNLPFRAIPDGDAVPPPELTRDVPVVDVFEPPDRLAAPGIGVDGDLHILQRIYGGLCELLHRDPPLLGEPRLYYRPAPVAVPDPVPVRSDLPEQPLLVEPHHKRRPRLLACHPGKGTTVLVDGTVVVQYVHRREAATLPDLEVVGVVGRRNLKDTRAELRVYVGVGQNLDLALDERDHDLPPHELFVPLVLRVHDE